MSLWSTLLLLADDLPLKKPVGDPQGAPGPTGDMLWIMFIGLGVVLALQFMIRPNDAKDKQRREQFLASLNKNDPVVTIGGIKGTFVSLSEDKTEVTIKVEGDVRLRMEAAAIREVPKPAPKA